MAIEIKNEETKKKPITNLTFLREAMEKDEQDKFAFKAYKMGLRARKALIDICDAETGAFIGDGQEERSLLPELLKEGFPYLEVFLSNFTADDMWKIMKNKIQYDDKVMSILTLLLHYDDREDEPEYYTEIFSFLLQHLTVEQRRTLLFTKDKIEGQEVTPYEIILKKRGYLLAIILLPGYLYPNSGITSDLTSKAVNEEDLLAHIEILDVQIWLISQLAKLKNGFEPLMAALPLTLKNLIDNKTKVQEALLQLGSVKALSSILLSSEPQEENKPEGRLGEIKAPPSSTSLQLRKRKHDSIASNAAPEKFAKVGSEATGQQADSIGVTEAKRNLMGNSEQPAPASTFQQISSEEKTTPSIITPLKPDSGLTPDKEIFENIWSDVTGEQAISTGVQVEEVKRNLMGISAQPLTSTFQQIFPESVWDSKTSAAVLPGTPMEIEVAGQAGLTPRQRTGNIMLLAKSMAKFLSFGGPACQTEPLRNFASGELPVVPEGSFLPQLPHGSSESKRQQPESLNTTEEESPIRPFSKL